MAKNIKTAYLSDHTTEVMDETEKGTWTAGLLPKDYGYSLPKMVKHLGGHCWEPFAMDLTKSDLDEAHRLGLKVVAWVGRSRKAWNSTMRRLKIDRFWVDGIITDRPDILRGILVTRGLNLPKGFESNEIYSEHIPKIIEVFPRLRSEIPTKKNV